MGSVYVATRLIEKPSPKCFWLAGVFVGLNGVFWPQPGPLRTASLPCHPVDAAVADERAIFAGRGAFDGRSTCWLLADVSADDSMSGVPVELRRFGSRHLEPRIHEPSVAHSLAVDREACWPGMAFL